MPELITKPDYPFLKGGGEMGHLTRSHNWAQTSLGTPDTWPQSLRTTLSILLNSKFPMFLFWGNELLCFYNDAYRPSLGNDGKHPTALGKPGAEVWPEIWPVIKPLIDQVLTGGGATWSEDQLIPIFRNGTVEDVYWTFSFSPVTNESDEITGVFVTCTETTEKVIREKQQQENDLLQAVFNGTTSGINVLRTIRDEANTVVDFEYQLVNRIAEQTNNRTDLVGKRCLDIHQDFKQAGLFDDFITVLETGQPIDRDRHYTGEGFNNWYATRIVKHEDGVVFSFLDITAQYTAQQQIKQSQQQLLALFEQSSVGIAIISEDDLTLQMANPFYGVMVGRKPDDIVGKPLLEALPELQGQGFDAILREVISTGIPLITTEVAVDIVRQEQLETIYVDVAYQPRRDPGSNRILGVFVVATDVTQQVRSRQRVEASEAKLKSLIATAPIGIGLFMGRDLVIDLPNQTFVDIVGKGPDIVGKPLREVMPELLTENQPFLQILDDVFTSGKQFHSYGSLVQIVQQGVMTHNYYNITYSPLVNEAGEVYAILDIAVDVTEQVLDKQKVEQTQADLLEINQRLSLALDAGNLGSFELERETGLMRCTPQCKANHGQQPDTTPSSYSGLIDMIIPDDRAGVEQAITYAFDTQTIYHVEYRVFWPDGSLHWIRASGQPVYSPDGQPTRMVGITQNITAQRIARKELERLVAERTQQLQESVNDLQRSNNNLQQFAYVASHDLQEPLRKIQSFGDMLRNQYKEELGESGNDYLLRMQASASRMSVLIKDLLTYSRISTQQDSSATVSLTSVINAVLADLDLAIQETVALVRVDSLPTVQGDKSQLGQLFQNLLNNALKFRKTGQTPQISITCQTIAATDLPPSVWPTREAIAYYRIDVADNGIGFDEQYVDRIFQVFQRLHGRSQFAGTGIGLAICEKVTANHGGAITASSQPGEGAIFSVYLPK